MRKLIGQFLVAWLVLIVTFITGGVMIFFMELLGNVMWLFPLMMFSLFVLNEVKKYTKNSKKGGQ
ncbi:hypothetical protein COF71_13785 [Bacillus toyonensis]|nr:hypothetical protein COM61_22690 [Bacillus toyonensis]PHE47022.1 hypothetical protein COF71_13785 [Bacillus toyonensis]